MSNFKVTTGRDGGRSFGEHDDRTERGYDRNDRGGYRGRRGRGNRRGGGGPYRGASRGRGSSYRGGRGGYRGRGGGYNRDGPNPMSRLLDDDDEDMGETSAGPSTTRFDPYKRTKNRPRGRAAMDEEQDGKFKRLGVPISSRLDRKGGNGASNSGQDTWYKVTIPYGAQSGKDFLLKSITNLSDVPFVPIGYKEEGNTSVFYVQDKQASDAIRDVSRRITSPKGFKVVIVVKASSPPVTTLSPETITKVEQCMSKRYDPATKALNLSNLYNDEDLKKEGIHLVLNRHNVMASVIKVISEHIPEVEILDFSENRLSKLVSMKELTTVAQNVTKLNLKNNTLRHENDLEPIKAWKIVDLFLEGNTLCDRFKDETSYVSAIRKIFPKVMLLDNHNLPPPITFDLEVSTDLPPTKGNYFGTNPAVEKLLCTFIHQYFTLYDDNRQALLDAYTEQAVFSMSVCMNKIIVGKQPPVSDYISESRNINKLRDPERRRKALKSGKINIVALLNEFPKTQHDPNSFVVDVIHSSPQMLCFSVRGLFKEESKRSDKTIRSFNRTFVTVPIGEGIGIVNECYSITNATPDQVKKAFTVPAPTPSSSPVDGIPNPLAGAAPPTINDEQKKLMIQKFCQDSGMNADWSSKCLEQNSWDYEKSGKIFLELQGKGAIPPEAFVK